MDELADSTSLLNDQDELRRRLAGDGYLFFRGLLPAAEVRAVGDAVLNRLRGLRALVGAAHRQPLRLGAAAITVYRQHGVLEARVWPLVT